MFTQPHGHQGLADQDCLVCELPEHDSLYPVLTRKASQNKMATMQATYFKPVYTALTMTIEYHLKKVTSILLVQFRHPLHVANPGKCLWSGGI